jgi:hypothetical protein
MRFAVSFLFARIGVLLSEERGDRPRIDESTTFEDIMQLCRINELYLDDEARSFYQRALLLLLEHQIPFLVGRAFALTCYTGIERHTKDFDVFIHRRDCAKLLSVLEQAGFRTEVTFAHWLAKAFHSELFFDIIYSSGNGLCPIDDGWFQHAVPAEIFGYLIHLCPIEEMIWQKAFIMERERFDGSDVNHLLRAASQRLDWRRLVDRFGRHWRVLLAHLILFGYTYLAERDQVPSWVLKELTSKLQGETASPPPELGRICQGTFLSRGQYLKDIEEWDYQDPRIEPGGSMTPRERDVWTDAMPERQ